MLDSKLLDMLRCPLTRTPLQVASEELVAAINSEIADSAARDRLGQLVQQPIETGLLTSDGQWLYPIRDGIPTMVADEAIQVEPND